MQLIYSAADLQRITREYRAQGYTIGFVPTMGALHNGHKSLVDRARRENDIVVVSVFVNPTQFNNPTDLSTYPRTTQADIELLEASGVDLAFFPAEKEIYPTPDTRVFPLGEVADVMEGPMRPGHFNGVAQVVSRLFELSNPTQAYFGEKDFQQIAVIRRMVQIIGADVKIISCPIVREADGLAMSSRNVRLTPQQRAVAPTIHRILAQSTKMPLLPISQLKKQVTEQIDATPYLRTEYFEIVHPMTMQPLKEWPDGISPQGCITVYCGDVRLIDNIQYPITKHSTNEPK